MIEADVQPKGGNAMTRNISIYSPVDGKIISKNKVKDEVFEKDYFGKGVSIYPENDKILSPVTGVIESISKEKHSMIIRTNSGTRVWVYIGNDIVQLKGRYIETFVKESDRVSQGDPLMYCEFDQMENLGYNIEVSLTVLKQKDLHEIIVIGEKNIKKKQPVIGILFHPNREAV